MARKTTRRVKRAHTYRIFAALHGETDKGWIWIKVPSLPSRTFVRLRAQYTHANKTSQKWVTFCEVRHIEKNFVDQYNKRGGGRAKITDPASAMVIGEWYRNALGGFPTTQQFDKRRDNREIPDIRVEELSRWRWWWALRAASHHPDMAVRLGTRLGVLGAWLGIVATVELIWKALRPVRDAVWHCLPTSFVGFLENWHEDGIGLLAMLVAVALGVLGILACRGPKRPVDLAAA